MTSRDNMTVNDQKRVNDLLSEGTIEFIEQEKAINSTHDKNIIAENISPEKLYRVGMQPKIYRPLKERKGSLGRDPYLKDLSY
jgi:hypothetical protein